MQAVTFTAVKSLCTRSSRNGPSDSYVPSAMSLSNIPISFMPRQSHRGIRLSIDIRKGKTDVPPMIKQALTHSIPFAALVLFSGCKSSVTVPGGAGTPKWVPSEGTSFSGSSATPPHNLPPTEYPFDAAGNYLPQMARGSQQSSSGTASSSRSRSSPASSSASSSRKTSGSKTHRISSGDTLWGLSKKYGVSVSAIKKANGMSSDKLVNGRSIRIP